MGFEMVEVTKLSGDGGIDVRGTLVVGDVVRIKMAVQVKKWKNNIQAPVVQQVRGSLGAHEQGLIITTSDFSPGAVKEAAQPDKTPIALMNGEQLVMLLMEHGIGVHRSTPDLFEIDEEFSLHPNTMKD
jgi:restriction system protein